MEEQEKILRSMSLGVSALGTVFRTVLLKKPPFG